MISAGSENSESKPPPRSGSISRTPGITVMVIIPLMFNCSWRGGLIHCALLCSTECPVLCYSYCSRLWCLYRALLCSIECFVVRQKKNWVLCCMLPLAAGMLVYMIMCSLLCSITTVVCIINYVKIIPYICSPLPSTRTNCLWTRASFAPSYNGTYCYIPLNVILQWAMNFNIPGPWKNIIAFSAPNAYGFRFIW